MRVRDTLNLRRTSFGRQCFGVLLEVDRDEVSLWLSSLREAIQSLGVSGHLFDRLGASYEELATSQDSLVKILGEMETSAADPMRLTGFSVDPFENSLVRSSLRRAKKRLSYGGPIETFVLLTTFQTLEVTAAFACETRTYLWPEEVHIITGYAKTYGIA